MKRIVWSISLIAVLFLLTACLEDLFPPDDYAVQQAMRLNPLSAPTSVSGFYYPNYGKPFSFDSSSVFYLSSSLRRKALNQYYASNLLPGNMRCTDRKYLAADTTAQKLYVAADNNIYSLKFDGTQLQNLTPANVDTLTAPSLSPDRRYLTFIRAGKINRLDLQTGTRVEIDNNPAAEYAIYRPDLDRYFFFTPYGPPYGRELYLCEWDGGAPTRVLWDDGSNTVFAVSADGRWFGMLNQPDKIVTTENTLRIWGSDSGSSFVLEKVSAFAFSPSSTELYYSQKVYGSTNIAKMTLGTPQIQMLFDGILSSERYFYPIWEITPRIDGEWLYFRGFTYKHKS
ncbi:MAG: hypothetical protein U1B83_03195 [Candidatus Cloacimonadaceae bacterium]|nr:hypothetical protein [Candidatus Cloacimonadaceae bacterium]